MSTSTFRVSIDVTVDVDDYAAKYSMIDTGEIYEDVSDAVIRATTQRFQNCGVRASVSQATAELDE